MGCGGSKQEIAANCTVSRRLLRNDTQGSQSKRLAALPHAGYGSEKDQEHSTTDLEKPEGAEVNAETASLGDRNSAILGEVKDIAVENVQENNDGTNEKSGLENGSKEDGRLKNRAKDSARLVSRDSPDKYFSSRKDEENVVGVVEGHEFYSPRYEPKDRGAGGDAFSNSQDPGDKEFADLKETILVVKVNVEIPVEGMKETVIETKSNEAPSVKSSVPDEVKD
ncbi:uncharacterized protein LOC18445236 [Amborella trichopoda]|uniref:Uncharacterized protein n=1 Tax=Amborella trichopoda TaxID=13333 RepID=U5CUB9_AMBTC|nr:uncharacterized protein LOC18445236 [Amborella trichopoda]ERN16906.1 hypothetical protein AMTR_s00057p00166690 [Amborella trichopoda]|eukprot:XP_006855439.1 uncharacterized protein LOC18445236 [Amborella trichopoda]